MINGSSWARYRQRYQLRPVNIPKVVDLAWGMLALDETERKSRPHNRTFPSWGCSKSSARRAFVTSIAAPVASGWSVRRLGLAPTGKRRLITAHTQHRHWLCTAAMFLMSVPASIKAVVAVFGAPGRPCSGASSSRFRRCRGSWPLRAIHRILQDMMLHILDRRSD